MRFVVRAVPASILIAMVTVACNPSAAAGRVA